MSLIHALQVKCGCSVQKNLEICRPAFAFLVMFYHIERAIFDSFALLICKYVLCQIFCCKIVLALAICANAIACTTACTYMPLLLAKTSYLKKWDAYVRIGLDSRPDTHGLIIQKNWQKFKELKVVFDIFLNIEENEWGRGFFWSIKLLEVAEVSWVFEKILVVIVNLIRTVKKCTRMTIKSIRLMWVMISSNSGYDDW